MKGLMMEYQLTLPTILRRAETLFGHKEIVSRLPDKTIHRYTYRDFALRTKKLSAALRDLGVTEGTRVATLSWNHYQHLETYFAVPCMGAVLHPLNLRLSPPDLAYIFNHAGDKIIIVDEVLLPLFEKFKSFINPTNVIVIPQTGQSIPGAYLNYEKVLAKGDESKFEPFESDEYAAALMCYTSGTTGRPKGVVYSHRSIMLHAMAFLLTCTGGGLNEADIVLPIVPMFHANAWGLPFSCAFVGASQVFAGPHLDAESLLELFEREKVTLTGGVPTVMLNIMRHLEAAPNKYKLFLRIIVLGGSQAPRFLFQFFEEKYGIKVLNTWGMTELSPLGTTAAITSKMKNASKDEQQNSAMKQGMPVPFVEIRGMNENGIIPWDGITMGELEVRGPWVCSDYYRNSDDQTKFTSDGWFKTGDIVTICDEGRIEIKDRNKDLIKSGGEWISSVAIENLLMEHPAILEAAVIAIPNEKWMERPFAYVVLREGRTVSPNELNTFLAKSVAKFWLPDGFAFIDAIPKTAVGKYLKSALREKYIKDNG